MTKEYVRVTKSVADYGTFIPANEVLDFIGKDLDQDWYQSPFTYGEDAVKYFKENDNSIKGYTGEVFTKTLYWDLDNESNFDKVQEAVSKLLVELDNKGLSDGVQVFFSGNKGAHVLLHTDTKFTPAETKLVCKEIAKKAGIDVDAKGEDKVFDPTVYNVNRIFRIANTRHPKSGLYKTQLTFDEILELSQDEIIKLAKKPNPIVDEFLVVQAGGSLKEDYKKTDSKPNNVVRLTAVTNGTPGLDLSLVPKGKRKCIYVLEQGYIESGERENACIRLAAYYKGQGIDRDQALSLINVALERRGQLYAGLNSYSDADTERIVDEVYSDGWNGGTYTCKTDELLASKCSHDGVPCSIENSMPDSIVVDINQLCEKYVKYTGEAKAVFPKTGIEWLDDRIRIRPRNFSIVNGANGSGKTSLVIQTLENFNKQGIYSVMFSLDMADTSLFEKLGSRYTNYSQREIEDAFQNKDEVIMKKVMEALRKHFPYTFFDFTALANSSYLEKVIRELNAKLKKEGVNKIIEVGIIDYAGRLSGDEGSAYMNATANALAANDIAKRQNIHLIYISQISRENGDHTTPIRTSRVSKDTGAWEENATFVINCWRPMGNGVSGKDNYMHIYIGKNRSGVLGEHAFYWEGKRGDIRELTTDEYEDYVRLCESLSMPRPPRHYEQEIEVNPAKMTKEEREKRYGDKFEVEENGTSAPKADKKQVTKKLSYNSKYSRN